MGYTTSASRPTDSRVPYTSVNLESKKPNRFKKRLKRLTNKTAARFSQFTRRGPSFTKLRDETKIRGKRSIFRRLKDRVVTPGSAFKTPAKSGLRSEKSSLISDAYPIGTSELPETVKTVPTMAPQKTPATVTSSAPPTNLGMANAKTPTTAMPIEDPFASVDPFEDDFFASSKNPFVDTAPTSTFTPTPANPAPADPFSFLEKEGPVAKMIQERRNRG